MQSLEGSSNEELLASLAGRPVAARLMGKFGGLSSPAQASFADLQQVSGVGPSKAAAIRSAFLLAQRLVRETYPDAPVVDSPERVVPECVTDRSLAIAHGLESVFWQEDPQKPGKWITRKVTDLELSGLIAERTSAAVKAAVESLVGATSNEGAPRKGRKGAKA